MVFSVISFLKPDVLAKAFPQFVPVHMSFVPVRFYNMPLQDECVPWHQGDFFSGVVVQETMSEIIAPKPTIDKVCFFMLSFF